MSTNACCVPHSLARVNLLLLAREMGGERRARGAVGYSKLKPKHVLYRAALINIGVVQPHLMNVKSYVIITVAKIKFVFT